MRRSDRCRLDRASASSGNSAPIEQAGTRFARSGLRDRPGFSLIEVVMATAFLMGSAIVLSKLAGMGREQSQKAHLHMQAQQVCEQTLNELMLGLRPIEITEGSPLLPLPEPVERDKDDAFNAGTSDLLESSDPNSELQEQTDNPEWRHSIRMESLIDKPGMWSLTVTVIQGAEELERPVRFSLTRWINGPPPEGAFDQLMTDEPSALNSGGAPQ